MRATRISRAALRAVLDGDPLLLATIDAIAQFELRDTEIVTGLHRDRDFVGVADLGVAAGFFDAHRWRAIGDGVHDILHRAGDHGAIDSLQIDAIEATLAQHKRSVYHAVAARRHWHNGAIVERQPTTLDGSRNTGMDHDRCTDNGGNIATIVDMLGGQSAICREAQIK